MRLRSARRSRHLAHRLAVACLVVGGAFTAACSAGPGGESLGSSSEALTANDKTAYEFFIGKGLTSYQAAGIVGNLDQESGMDPTISQYGGGPGRGIAQWSAGGRWDTDSGDNVEWYAGQEGESATSLTLQLQFIWYELTTFSGYGLSELRASTNVSAATIAFETYYEGCGECDQSNRISYAEAALAAYGSTPPPPPPIPTPRGYLDSATCSTVAGWTELAATPSDTLFADIYFNGAAGSSSATGIRTTAGNDRADLCTAIGSCDHGFSLATPRGVMDGAAHEVYAYGINPTSGGANTLLSDAPKSVTCAAPAIAAGSVKRHVTSPTILTDWRFDTFVDMAAYDTAEVAAVPSGVDFGQAPDVVQASGDPAVYVVDGTYRRHIINPTSLAAWRLTSADIKSITAAALAALTDGPNWPAAPLLIKDPTAPSVYLLDVPFPAPDAPDAGAVDAGTTDDDSGTVVPSDAGGVIGVPVPTGDAGHHHAGDDAGTTKSKGSGDKTDADADETGSIPVGSAGGCTVSPRSQGADVSWIAMVVVGLALTSRSRRHRRA